MKYLKCVKQGMPKRETNFKIGVIYKLNQKGREYTITCTDTNLGKGKPYTYSGDDDFEEWIKPWYEFEEVTREDYILQEFVNGNISIQFADSYSCEYWRKEILNKFKENNILYDFWNMDSVEISYYVRGGELRACEYDGFKELENFMLFKEEEIVDKEEKKEMNKKFTKSDLKDGMIVKFREPLFEDSLHIFLNGNFLNNDGINYTDLDGIDDDLKYAQDNGYDVMEVYKTTSNSFNNIFNKQNLELIWKRDEDLTKKEYKLKELTICPNGNTYIDDEREEIFIQKENIWDEDEDKNISISLEEAKFMIESLTEIVNTIEKYN